MENEGKKRKKGKQLEKERFIMDFSDLCYSFMILADKNALAKR